MTLLLNIVQRLRELRTWDKTRLELLRDVVGGDAMKGRV